MDIKRKTNKRAISPVLATVILIAITLIAAIAIAGFVFGLFGSFTSTAQVSVTSAALTGGGAPPAGTVSAMNIGTSNANINSISLTYGGVTCAAAITSLAPWTVGAGAGSVGFTVGPGVCGAATSGEAFTGNLALSNGGQVPFSGTFS